MRGNENRPPHPREPRGGGVLGAPESRQTSPFPPLGSGVALTMEGAKGKGQGSRATRGQPGAPSLPKPAARGRDSLWRRAWSSARPPRRCGALILKLSVERSGEPYRTPEIPGGWGAREGLCISRGKATRLAWADWNPAWVGVTGGRMSRTTISGSPWTPSSLCGLPQESLLHPFPPHSPSLGLALHLKFKGFKCKYFSFIDASCLQRARFLAAQLYCPISFLYQGTGEPGGMGGWGERGVADGGGKQRPLRWFQSRKLPPRVPCSAGMGWGAGSKGG